MRNRRAYGLFVFASIACKVEKSYLRRRFKRLRRSNRAKCRQEHRGTLRRRMENVTVNRRSCHTAQSTAQTASEIFPLANNRRVRASSWSMAAGIAMSSSRSLERLCPSFSARSRFIMLTNLACLDYWMCNDATLMLLAAVSDLFLSKV